LLIFVVGFSLRGWLSKAAKARLSRSGTAEHSYPIKPASFASGSIVTTSSIRALHRGHAKPLPFGNFDTPHARDSLHFCDNPPARNRFYLEENEPSLYASRHTFARHRAKLSNHRQRFAQASVAERPVALPPGTSERAMPITQFLDGERLDEETRRALGLAFEMTCIALRVGDCADDVRQAVANKLIALAKVGERNPDRLCEEALKDIRTPQQWAASEAAKSSVLSDDSA